MTPWRHRSLTLGLSLLTSTAYAQGLVPTPQTPASAPGAPSAAAEDGAGAAAIPGLPATPAPATLVPAQADGLPDLNRPRLEKPSRAGAVELTWLGHAAWLLRSPAGTTVLIDPWLTNPRAPQDFVLPEHVDAILVTHGHADHLGEAAALARKLGAPVIASHELVEQLGVEGGIGINPGATVHVKDLHLHPTTAVHSSSMPLPAPPPPHGACSCHHGPEGEKEPDADKGAPAVAKPDAKAGQKPGKGEAMGGGRKGGHHNHGVHPTDHRHTKAELTHGVHAAAQATEAAATGKPAAPGELLPPENQAHEHGPHMCEHGDHAPHVCEHGGQGPHVCDHGEHGEHHHHGHAIYAGAPLGFVIQIDNGPTLYHAGDTDVFGDMALIAERYAPEVALLPIGGHYTMDPVGAALAARKLGVKDVIPMHYGTFPQLQGTPEALREALGKDARVIAPSPGARVSFGPASTN